MSDRYFGPLQPYLPWDIFNYEYYWSTGYIPFDLKIENQCEIESQYSWRPVQGRLDLLKNLFLHQYFG